MNNNQSVKASASAGGIGFFGVLIVLGILGLGPCADSCNNCGPTIADVAKQVKCE